MAPPTLRVTAVLVLLVLASPAALAAPAAGAEDCGFPVTAVDATGTTVTVDAEPTTVVTLAPSAAQTMWEIGAEGKVVGVSPQADYLSGASSRTTVSNYPSVDAETVVNLDPDLVLAPNAVADEDVERLRSLGLTVYKFEAAETIEDVYAKTTLTGRLVGACDGAADTVASMQSTIREARAALEGRDRKPVFYHMGGGWTAGSGTFIDELIGTAGGENVAAAAGVSGYQVLSAEVMIERDPAWFIRGSVPVPDSSPYSQTTAGRNDRVIVVDANYMNQPAPRIVEPIVAIVEALHPEVDLDVAGGGVTEDLTTGSASHTTRVTVDGALEVAVTGLYANRTYRVDLPTDAGPHAGDGVELRAIDLALAEPNPDFLLRVEGPGADGPPPPEAPDRRTLRRLSVAPNGLLAEDVESVTYRVRVPAAALGDAAPADLSLSAHRSGTWTRLETTATRDDGAVVLVGTSDGLAPIAVGAPAVAEPTPTVTATTDGPPAPTATPTPTGQADTPTATAVTTATPAASPTSDGPVAETSGQPGFGLIGAVAALLVVVLGRRGSP